MSGGLKRQCLFVVSRDLLLLMCCLGLDYMASNYYVADNAYLIKHLPEAFDRTSLRGQIVLMRDATTNKLLPAYVEAVNGDPLPGEVSEYEVVDHKYVIMRVWNEKEQSMPLSGSPIFASHILGIVVAGYPHHPAAPTREDLARGVHHHNPSDSRSDSW